MPRKLWRLPNGKLVRGPSGQLWFCGEFCPCGCGCMGKGSVTVSFGNVTNGTCDCNSEHSGIDFSLDRVGECEWRGTRDVDDECLGTIVMTATYDPDTFYAEVTFAFSGGFTATFSGTGDGEDCFMTLDYTGGASPPECDFTDAFAVIFPAL